MDKYIVETKARPDQANTDASIAREDLVSRKRGRISRVMRCLFGPERGAAELSDGTELGTTESPEEKEARLVLERLWRLAMLALIDDGNRHLLTSIDSSSAIPLLVPRHHTTERHGEGEDNGHDISVDPILWENDGSGPTVIRIDTELGAVTRAGNGIKKVRITLVKDNLARSSLAIREAPEAPSAKLVELHPTDARIVMAQLSRSFSVTARQLDAYPFDKQG